MVQKITLPSSVGGEKIQVLTPGAIATNTAVIVTTSSTALPTGAGVGDIIRVAATQDCHINFGNSGVTATAAHHLFTSGIEYFTVPALATHLAAIRVATDGTMSITLMV